MNGAPPALNLGARRSGSYKRLGHSIASVQGFVRAALCLICLSGAAFAQVEKATTIHVVIVETHDRLTPTPKPGIVKRHEFTVVLQPNKQIDESWEQADITHSAHADPGGERSTAMGENNGRAVWHVLGANKLQRIAQNHEQLIIWNIEISQGQACHIDVRYLLKQGVTFTTGKIAGTDVDATFSHSQVVSATCRIE
jgi:hypothetical protein